PFGTGTFNSRSMAVGGSAVFLAARKIMEKVTKIAAYRLQRRPSDLVYENGVFRSRPHAGSLAHVAMRTAQKGLPIIFKRRTGFDFPVPPDVEAVSFSQIAEQAHLGQDLPLGMAPGLEETHFFDPKDLVFGYGAHLSVVEVDPETGHIGLYHHAVVD